MNLFIDTSVLLAASVSPTGASRIILSRAGSLGWQPIVTPYVLAEVDANSWKLSDPAVKAWRVLRPTLRIEPDVFVLDRPSLFMRSKDRPVLYAAVAYAEVLLTLDREDFRLLLDSTFYGLLVTTPGGWLERTR